MSNNIKAFNRMYTLVDTIKTTISAGYLNDSGSRRNEWECFRETVQNMMDEAQYMVDHNGGVLFDYFTMYKHQTKPYIVFQDKGRGVDLEKILLIGESGKRGTDYKGQKGEGEILSFLVATRLGLDKMMLSKNWLIKTRFDSYSDNGDYQVLVVDVYKTETPIEGTVWYLEKSSKIEEYFNERTQYFPELSKLAMKQKANREEKNYKRYLKARNAERREERKEVKAKSTHSVSEIITPRAGKNATLYVRGVFVKEINALFSYNLTTVEINRDRSMVSDLLIYDHIKTAFDGDDLNIRQVETYWQESKNRVSTKMELKVTFDYTLENNRDLILKGFYKVFGKKAVLHTDRFASIDASSIGYEVVDIHPMAATLAQLVGVQTDKQVAGFVGRIQPLKNIPETYNKINETMKAICEVMGVETYPVVIVKRILGITEDSVLGMFDPVERKVLMLQKGYDTNRIQLLETYIHECGHGNSNCGDGSRGFTQFFETLVIKLMTMETGKQEYIKKLVKEITEL